MNKKTKKTNNGKEGGKVHGDSHAAPSGGVEAVITDKDGSPVLLEHGEIVINKTSAADKKVKVRKGTNLEVLNEINTENNNGIPIINSEANKYIDFFDENEYLFNQNMFFEKHPLRKSNCEDFNWVLELPISSETDNKHSVVLTSDESDKHDAMDDIHKKFVEWANKKISDGI